MAKINNLYSRSSETTKSTEIDTHGKDTDAHNNVCHRMRLNSVRTSENDDERVTHYQTKLALIFENSMSLKVTPPKVKNTILIRNISKMFEDRGLLVWSVITESQLRPVMSEVDLKLPMMHYLCHMTITTSGEQTIASEKSYTSSRFDILYGIDVMGTCHWKNSISQNPAWECRWLMALNEVLTKPQTLFFKVLEAQQHVDYKTINQPSFLTEKWDLLRIHMEIESFIVTRSLKLFCDVTSLESNTIIFSFQPVEIVEIVRNGIKKLPTFQTSSIATILISEDASVTQEEDGHNAEQAKNLIFQLIIPWPNLELFTPSLLKEENSTDNNPKSNFTHDFTALSMQGDSSQRPAKKTLKGSRSSNGDDISECLEVVTSVLCMTVVWTIISAVTTCTAFPHTSCSVLSIAICAFTLTLQSGHIFLKLLASACKLVFRIITFLMVLGLLFMLNIPFVLSSVRRFKWIQYLEDLMCHVLKYVAEQTHLRIVGHLSLVAVVAAFPGPSDGNESPSSTDSDCTEYSLSHKENPECIDRKEECYDTPLVYQSKKTQTECLEETNGLEGKHFDRTSKEDANEEQRNGVLSCSKSVERQQVVEEEVMLSKVIRMSQRAVSPAEDTIMFHKNNHSSEFRFRHYNDPVKNKKHSERAVLSTLTNIIAGNLVTDLDIKCTSDLKKCIENDETELEVDGFHLNTDGSGGEDNSSSKDHEVPSNSELNSIEHQLHHGQRSTQNEVGDSIRCKEVCKNINVIPQNNNEDNQNYQSQLYRLETSSDVTVDYGFKDHEGLFDSFNTGFHAMSPKYLVDNGEIIVTDFSLRKYRNVARQKNTDDKIVNIHKPNSRHLGDPDDTPVIGSPISLVEKHTRDDMKNEDVKTTNAATVNIESRYVYDFMEIPVSPQIVLNQTQSNKMPSTRTDEFGKAGPRVREVSLSCLSDNAVFRESKKLTASYLERSERNDKGNERTIKRKNTSPRRQSAISVVEAGIQGSCRCCLMQEKVLSSSAAEKHAVVESSRNKEQDRIYNNPRNPSAIYLDQDTLRRFDDTTSKSKSKHFQNDTDEQVNLNGCSAASNGLSFGQLQSFGYEEEHVTHSVRGCFQSGAKHQSQQGALYISDFLTDFTEFLLNIESSIHGNGVFCKEISSLCKDGQNCWSVPQYSDKRRTMYLDIRNDIIYFDERIELARFLQLRRRYLHHVERQGEDAKRLKIYGVLKCIEKGKPYVHILYESRKIVDVINVFICHNGQCCHGRSTKKFFKVQKGSKIKNVMQLPIVRSLMEKILVEHPHLRDNMYVMLTTCGHSWYPSPSTKLYTTCLLQVIASFGVCPCNSQSETL